MQDIRIKDGVYISAKETLSFQFESSLIDLDGYTRIAWFPYSIGQNFMQISLSFVANSWYLTITNEYSKGLTVDIRIYLAYLKNISN